MLTKVTAVASHPHLKQNDVIAFDSKPTKTILSANDQQLISMTNEDMVKKRRSI